MGPTDEAYWQESQGRLSFYNTLKNKRDLMVVMKKVNCQRQHLINVSVKKRK